MSEHHRRDRRRSREGSRWAAAAACAWSQTIKQETAQAASRAAVTRA